MSRFEGPQGIVTNGLVLNLDAGDPDSYTRSQPPFIEVLVVAGGGSGGGSTAGGGGAGGLIYNSAYQITNAAAITVTVGAGGAGVAQTTVGNDGSNSVFGALTAIGGGGGGMTNGSGGAIGRNGGSGGGGAHYSSMNFGTPGTGTPGQGNNGGNGSTGDQDSFPSGGGGGAGAVGGDATNSKSGNGGNGLTFSISGTSTTYAGGGGGGSISNGGNGGTGGGAAGTSNGTAGGTATANTGGGGGGGWFYSGGSGGAGGSGIVIVRYPGLPAATGGTIAYLNGYTIHTFTTSGTFTPFLWNDVSGNSNNGILTNGPNFVPNIQGGYFNFDGTDDFVNCGNASSFNILRTVTMELWFKVNGFGSPWTNVFGKMNADGDSSTRCYTAFINSAGFVHFVTADSSGQEHLDSTNFISTGVWYHWIGVINRNTGVLEQYVNGALNATGSVRATDIVTNSDPVRVGYAGGYYQRYNGIVSIARIYNRALSQAEITQNFNAARERFGFPPIPVINGLLLYWDASNINSYPGTGTTIYDLSGNGYHGTLYNGVGFNQTNGGVLTFDGVDDILYNNSINLSSTNNTVMGAARYSGGTRGRMINSTNNNWLMGHWNNSTENYYAEGTIALSAGPNDTNWRIYSALGDVSGDSYSLYVNNSLSAGPSNGGVAGPNGISVGAQGYGGEYSTGQFSFVLVYNRVLTTDEMTQNYNYFKSRFGL
jgi:hypothetical protein